MSIDPDTAKEMIRLSPVAWQHINFIGNYEFYTKGIGLSIQELTKKLLEDLKTDFSLQI